MTSFSFEWMSKEFMHGYGYGISSMNTNLKRACLYWDTFILIFKYSSIYLLMGTRWESIVLTDLEVASWFENVLLNFRDTTGKGRYSVGRNLRVRLPLLSTQCRFCYYTCLLDTKDSVVRMSSQTDLHFPKASHNF